MTTPVFGNYDQDALDRQYDNRAKVPDIDDYLARYVERSAQARETLEATLDLRYGDHPAETLDVFTARAGAGGEAPIHVFFHGGYWTRMDKRDFSYVANAFAPAGITTVVVNYALIPSVDMDGLIAQCRESIAWLWRNARDHGGNPDDIHVSGHSAGGHIVAMLLATDWEAIAPDVPGDVVKSATSVSGLHDLVPITRSFLNRDGLGLTPEMARRNDPVSLPRRSPARLLLAVGDLEGPEYLRQSTDLAHAWRDPGPPPELLVMEGEHHFSIAMGLDHPHAALARRIRGLMAVQSAGASR